MSGWQVGDLALCVDDRINPSVFGERVKSGRIYRVIGVRIGRTRHDVFGQSDMGLVLDGIRSGTSTGSFASARFRKIKPDTGGANEDDAAWLKELLAKPKVRVET